MFSIKKIWPFFFGLAFALWLLLTWILESRIDSVTVQKLGIKPEASVSILLPYKEKSAYEYKKVPGHDIPTHLYTLKMTSGFFQKAIWHITADDCVSEVSVNNKKIPLNKFSKKTLCDYEQGFILDISSFLNKGENTVTIKVSDTLGAMYGLSIKPLAFKTYPPLYNTLILFFGVGFVWSLILQKKGFDSLTIAISLFSLFFCLFFFSKTNYTEFTPDSIGHGEYLQYIKDNLTIPEPGKGWQFYHAPLYYILASLAGFIGFFFKLDYIASARHFSIICLLFTKYQTLKLIWKMIETKRIAQICSACFLFWPLLLALTGRITNDVLLYGFWISFYYHLYVWQKENNQKSFAITFFLCALMMLIKVSALVPLATLGILIIYKLVRKEMLWKNILTKPVLIGMGFIILTMGLSFGRIAYYKWKHDPQMNLVISNVHLDKGVKTITTTNKVEYFINPGLKSLFTEPFWYFKDKKTGRDYLIPSFIKSSLWGFFTWPNPNLARVINIFLFYIILFSIITVFILKSSPKNRFLIYCMLVMLVSHVINRILYKTFPTHDARYVFPIIGLFIIFNGILAESAKENGKVILEKIIQGNLVYFSFLTSLYMIMSALLPT